jgi:hypothetical protein
MWFLIRKGAVTVGWISAIARHVRWICFAIWIILHFRFGFFGVRRTFDYNAVLMLPGDADRLRRHLRAAAAQH